jgi:DNA-binding cell septation regulator SpoVG
MENTIDPNEVGIEIHHNVKGDMLAQVKLIFGIIKISGYRIMRSRVEEGELFVLAPSIRTSSGKWIKIVYVENEPLWKDIELRILKEFREEVKEGKNEDEGEIEPEEIEEFFKAELS